MICSACCSAHITSAPLRSHTAPPPGDRRQSVLTRRTSARELERTPPRPSRAISRGRIRIATRPPRGRLLTATPKPPKLPSPRTRPQRLSPEPLDDGLSPSWLAFRLHVCSCEKTSASSGALRRTHELRRASRSGSFSHEYKFWQPRFERLSCPKNSPKAKAEQYIADSQTSAFSTCDTREAQIMPRTLKTSFPLATDLARFSCCSLRSWCFDPQGRK